MLSHIQVYLGCVTSMSSLGDVMHVPGSACEGGIPSSILGDGSTLNMLLPGLHDTVVIHAVNHPLWNTT